MTARFQKRHYDAIADALKDAYTAMRKDSEARYGIMVAISSLATMLEQDNPRFDRDHFLRAAYGVTTP